MTLISIYYGVLGHKLVLRHKRDVKRVVEGRILRDRCVKLQYTLAIVEGERDALQLDIREKAARNREAKIALMATQEALRIAVENHKMKHTPQHLSHRPKRQAIHPSHSDLTPSSSSSSSSLLPTHFNQRICTPDPAYGDH